MSSARINVKKAALQAALELFSKQGFHAAPMAQLADLAGVGVGSIYRHFADKTDLIEELYQAVDSRLQQALGDAIDTALPFRQQFIQLITALVNYMQNHPRECKFLEQYYHSPFGIDKRREKFLVKPAAENNSAVQKIFFSPELKPLPMPVLYALAFGPVLYLMRDVVSGLVELDEAVITLVAEGSWEAISDR